MYFRTQAYYDLAPWRGTLADDGGALMNQAIHSVDLMLWLLGPAAQLSAFTTTQTHDIEAEDMAVVSGKFEQEGFFISRLRPASSLGFNPA